MWMHIIRDFEESLTHEHLVGKQGQNPSTCLVGRQTKWPLGWAHFEIMGCFLRRKEAQFQWFVLVSRSAFSENGQGLSCNFLSSFFCYCQHKSLAVEYQSIKLMPANTGSLWGCLCLWVFFILNDNLSQIFPYGKSSLTVLPGWVNTALFLPYLPSPFLTIPLTLSLLLCQMEISDSAIFTFPISYPVTLWSLIMM